AAIMTGAPARSESCDALPAVVVPPGKTGCSLASPSKVVSGRGPSSRSSVTSTIFDSLVALSTCFMVVLNGRISSAYLPAAVAAATRAWLFTTYSSCASREMPYFFETKSAVWFIVHQTEGMRCWSGGREQPPQGRGRAREE